MIRSRSAEAWGIAIVSILLLVTLWLNMRGWVFIVAVFLALLLGFLCYEEGEATQRRERHGG